MTILRKTFLLVAAFAACVLLRRCTGPDGAAVGMGWSGAQRLVNP